MYILYFMHALYFVIIGLLRSYEFVYGYAEGRMCIFLNDVLYAFNKLIQLAMRINGLHIL